MKKRIIKIPVNIALLRAIQRALGRAGRPSEQCQPSPVMPRGNRLSSAPTGSQHMWGFAEYRPFAECALPLLIGIRGGLTCCHFCRESCARHTHVCRVPVVWLSAKTHTSGIHENSSSAYKVSVREAYNRCNYFLRILSISRFN